ncbi:hypothetical protein OIU79_023122 [Salix purpurea]|uniref:Ubiquitin-like domain-containing protein n=1 Tax=Salix purpurea TaxID=77065 RepID=A0A9Q1ADK6_SALPP|nr:hypothetical protein OIU79_023122 [Salix purpurea]
MLNDYRTLLSYGIVGDTTLSLRYKILVHVQPNRGGISKEYELFVHDYNTVANLKQMLNFEYGIDIRSIELKMGNDNLEDCRKIWGSDIKPGIKCAGYKHGARLLNWIQFKDGLVASHIAHQ